MVARGGRAASRSVGGALPPYGSELGREGRDHHSGLAPVWLIFGDRLSAIGCFQVRQVGKGSHARYRWAVQAALEVAGGRQGAGQG